MPNFMRNEKGVFHNNDFFRGNLKGIEENSHISKAFPLVCFIFLLSTLVCIGMTGMLQQII